MSPDDYTTIEVPVQNVFLEKIDQLRGHLSRGEWALILIQAECRNPQAKVFSAVDSSNSSWMCLDGSTGMRPSLVPQPGPCARCGATGYPLSMGGPSICPACDCMPPERRVKDLAAENRRLQKFIRNSYGSS